MSIAYVVIQPYDLHPFPACRARGFLFAVMRVRNGSQRVYSLVFLALLAPPRVINRFAEIDAAAFAQRAVKHHVCYIAHHFTPSQKGLTDWVSFVLFHPT